MRFVGCRIRKLRQTEGPTVIALVQFPDGHTEQLGVSFPPLLEWRMELDDEAIVKKLSKHRVTVWVREREVVRVQTETKQSEKTKLSGSREQTTGANNPRLQRIIEHVLRAEKAWIHPGEVEVLLSIKSQLESGRTASRKQEALVKRIRERAEKRQEPKFFRG